MTTIDAADQTAAREDRTRRVALEATANRRVARARGLLEVPFADPAVKQFVEVKKLTAHYKSNLHHINLFIAAP